MKRFKGDITTLELTNKEFEFLIKDLRKLLADLEGDDSIGAFMTRNALITANFFGCLWLMKFPCTEDIFKTYRVDDSKVAFMLPGHEEVLDHLLRAISTKLEVEMKKRRGW